jgi:ribosome-interacting GTPase 1
MVTIAERIEATEEEIRKTPKNKATEHHLGRLKAKLARLKVEEEKRRAKAAGGGTGYGIKKSGHATVAIVGFPSVGKSTLLNAITAAKSDVGDYDFTTMDVVPGIMEHEGAKIQVLDLPGLISGASKGKGRGREVLSVVRAADLILLMIDVFETNVGVLVEELSSAGLRLNQDPPKAVLSKRDRGGVEVNTTVNLTHVDPEAAEDLAREWGLVNADIVLREDMDQDRFIDFLAGNRVYVPAFVVLNKVDLVTEAYVRRLRERLSDWEVLTISAEEKTGLGPLREAIVSRLRFMKVFLKPQGMEADMDEPLIVREASTVEMVCNILHRDFSERFRYANVWGPSAKFPAQQVGKAHVLQDGDVLSIVLRK